MAQSFIACATTSAIDGSSSAPSSTVFFNFLNTLFGRRSLITVSLNTFLPNTSATFTSSLIDSSFLSFAFHILAKNESC